MTDSKESTELGRGNDLTEFVSKIRDRTPARLLSGRAGSSYRTQTQIDLRKAHAAAQDAVRAELDLSTAFGPEFPHQWNLFEVRTQATSKKEYLLRPDLGRRFDPESRAQIANRRISGIDIQIAIGDGLSVPAVSIQAPALIALLHAGAKDRGWQMGPLFAIHHCRVGILNEIGELLDPRVAVLLIGERPGLATPDSLSAYMAYRPAKRHTDADRNLLSNIHARGVRSAEAANRILNLAAQMMREGRSGYLVKEEKTPSTEQPTQRLING